MKKVKYMVFGMKGCDYMEKCVPVSVKYVLSGYPHTIDGPTIDDIRWCMACNGVFTVKMVYPPYLKKKEEVREIPTSAIRYIQDLVEED